MSLTFPVIAVDPANPPDERLQPGVDRLEGGEVLALPTETVYGLAVDGFNADALRRLNQLKGKAEDSPVLLLMAEAGQAAQVCDRLPSLFLPLAERFWPGPLTLVVPAAAALPQEVSGGRGTVAVRVPGLKLPRRLARLLGRPISGVSANLLGEPPCRNAAEVVSVFQDKLGLIFDGGPTSGGAPSTILDLTTREPRLLREGLLPMSSLRPFLRRQGV